MTNASSQSSEMVVFRLHEEEYCIDIMQVREIRGWTAATQIPHAPSFILGVINLRGTVLPIIDLGARFGLQHTEPTARHAIVVTQFGQHTAGLLVDAVSDILTVDNSKIQPTPDCASDLAQSFIKGVIALEGQMISIISTENILPEAIKDAA